MSSAERTSKRSSSASSSTIAGPSPTSITVSASSMHPPVGGRDYRIRSATGTPRRCRGGAPTTTSTLVGMSDTPSGNAPERRHSRLARVAVAVSASLSLVIGVGSAYGFVAYQQAGDDGPTVPPPTGSPLPEVEQAFGPCVEDVCNYLLIGSDSRAGLSADELDQFGTDKQIGGENRADTIMLVHTDPALEKAII